MMGKKRPRETSGWILPIRFDGVCRSAPAANPHVRTRAKVLALDNSRRKSVLRTVDTPLTLDEAESSRLGGWFFSHHVYRVASRTVYTIYH